VGDAALALPRLRFDYTVWVKGAVVRLAVRTDTMAVLPDGCTAALLARSTPCERTRSTRRRDKRFSNDGSNPAGPETRHAAVFTAQGTGSRHRRSGSDRLPTLRGPEPRVSTRHQFSGHIRDEGTLHNGCPLNAGPAR